MITAPQAGTAAGGGSSPARAGGFAHRLKHRPLGLAALVFLVLLVAAVISAPLIAPYGPLTEDLQHVFEGPSAHHLLGTDNLGRDVLSRLLYGGRVSLFGVAEALGTALVLGVPAGLAAGYLGGWFDAVVLRLTDVVLAVPVIITLLVVLSVFSQSETAAMIALGVLGAPALIRVVRSAAIAVRPELYITAAKVAGLSHGQILRRHVLPRTVGPIIVQASLFAGVALVTETGLGFLGLGVQDPAPSWGGMVADASDVISQDPWLLVPSGALIGLTVLALGLVGDAARDSVGSRGAPRAHPRKHPRTGRGSSAGPARQATAAPAAPAATSALLRVRHLSVAFAAPGGDGADGADVSVVQDISFDVYAGEAVGLVGESGCGKTVTALAILGLLPAAGVVTAGSCVLEGRELAGLPERQYRQVRGSRVALISQDPATSLDPSFTVGNQILQVVRRHQRVSRAGARARTLDLLEQVEMPDPARTARLYPHELSGGMAQRVCIAAALAGRPRLLIADEPTTALDVTVQAEILDLLHGIKRDTGMAILLITHDWGVVADLCDRAIVIYAGQVVESSSVAALLARPMHPYTDGLLRSSPRLTQAGQELTAIPGTVPSPRNLPPGCRFQPRCAYATVDCASQPVSLDEPEPGRFTRCLHHEQLPSGATPSGASR
jgi:peptide/nickel transport system permease protein